MNRIHEEHREALRMAEIEKFIEASGQCGNSWGIVDSFLRGVSA